MSPKTQKKSTTPPSSSSSSNPKPKLEPAKNKTRKVHFFPVPQVKLISPGARERNYDNNFKKYERSRTIASIADDQDFKEYLENLKSSVYRHPNPKKYRRTIIRLEKARNALMKDIKKNHTMKRNQSIPRSKKASLPLEPSVYVPKQNRKSESISSPSLVKIETPMNSNEKKILSLSSLIKSFKKSLSMNR